MWPVWNESEKGFLRGLNSLKFVRNFGFEFGLCQINQINKTLLSLVFGSKFGCVFKIY